MPRELLLLALFTVTAVSTMAMVESPWWGLLAAPSLCACAAVIRVGRGRR